MQYLRPRAATSSCAWRFDGFSSHPERSSSKRHSVDQRAHDESSGLADRARSGRRRVCCRRRGRCVHRYHRAPAPGEWLPAGAKAVARAAPPRLRAHHRAVGRRRAVTLGTDRGRTRPDVHALPDHRASLANANQGESRSIASARDAKVGDVILVGERKDRPVVMQSIYRCRIAPPYFAATSSRASRAAGWRRSPRAPLAKRPYKPPPPTCPERRCVDVPHPAPHRDNPPPLVAQRSGHGP